MIPNHLENISGENQHPKTYKPINIYGYILGKPPALQQWKVKASIGPFIKFKRLFKVYPLSQDVAVDLKIYKQSMFSCANMTIHLTIDEACWTRQCNSCGHSTRSLPKGDADCTRISSKKNSANAFSICPIEKYQRQNEHLPQFLACTDVHKRLFETT